MIYSNLMTVSCPGYKSKFVIALSLYVQMLFQAVGKEPNFMYAPLWLFDAIINSLQWFADTFKSEQFENAAELGRIGKYYAVEDMLTTDPNEKYGTMKLQEHYNKIAVEGQEYDPYTTM